MSKAESMVKALADQAMHRTRDQMRQVQIKDIERLIIKSGEVLVVTVQNDISVEEADDIRQRIATNLPEGIKFLIKTQNVSFSVVAESDG